VGASGDRASLVAADAKRIDGAFQERLATFDSVVGRSLPPASPSYKRRSSKPTRAISAESIDKSEFAYPEPRRVRNREHVRFVAKQPCLICGRRPSDPHHLRFTQHRALGRKVSDEFTVPLCRGHHREVHRCGEEPAWWQKSGIDPTATARALWLQTHPLLTTPAEETIEDARTRVAVTPDLNSDANRPLAARGPNYKTKPIIRALPDDLIPADRGQPPQCFQKHRANDRRRQAAFPLQCRAPWTESAWRLCSGLSRVKVS
jgi:hypothetical protein